jgi:carbamoyl-phosphate synthase large subunit
VQFAICRDTVYVLEANPRASRTVPIVSKVCGMSMARIATEIMLGKKLKEFDLKDRTFAHCGVKESVFPFSMFPEVDPVLGPEMRSTGEVLGMADSFGMAFYKAQDAAKSTLPTTGTVLLTVCCKDRSEVLVSAAKQFVRMGFSLLATKGTQAFLTENGIKAELALKVQEGRPNIADLVSSRSIQLVINTPSGKLSAADDSYIRKAAIKHKIPYITTVTAAMAAAEGIAARLKGDYQVRSLQSYHADIK